MKKISVFLLLYIFFLLNNLFAQSTTGNMEGWVFDADNQPIISANILITSAELQGSRGAATDTRGYFRIQALPVGTYTVKISHISYQQVSLDRVTILLGKTTSIGVIHLTEKSIETEPVVVLGRKPVIDTRSTTNGKNLSATQFDKLPVERNYFQLAELLPNANISYKGDRGTNFSGGTGIENKYFVDGADISTPTFGGWRIDLPYNFIREVEVRTGGYDAEFQSSLGGIMNAVTYSGGNEFHGTIFSYLTNNSLRGSPRLADGQSPEGDFSNFDIGFGVGGHIIKDRLWYYAAYDPNFIYNDVFVNGLGMQNSYKTEHKFAGKLTWSLDENNLITLAVSGSPYKERQIIGSSSVNSLKTLSLESATRDNTILAYNSILRGIHTISDVLFLESSLSFGALTSTIKPALQGGEALEYFDYISMTHSGGLGITQVKSDINLFDGSIKGTLSLSEHTIKAGFGYEIISTYRYEDWNLLSRYPTYYYYQYELLDGTVKQKNFSAFLQDSWQIAPRICFNVGIRWDPQWLIASDGSLAQKITDQVQPRIGVIYQPGELGTQKITASFGRFYQPLQQALSIVYHLKGAYLYGIFYPNDPRVDSSGAFYYTPNMNAFVTNIPNLKGQYEDEFSLGYERMLSSEYKFGIHGIYRYLGQGVEDGVVSPEDQIKYNTLQVYGNPGSGMLSMFPKLKREYTSLELTLERFSPGGLNFFISYVLSRNRGNYDGLAQTYDGTMVWPNTTNQSALPERMVNADGLLPNDRTHVIKISGSYVFDFGLTAGIVFQWMSGTPLNEFGVDSTFGQSTFLQPRGSVGRTPSIWDLNFRFMYDFSNLLPIYSTKLVLDLMHVASQRTELDYDQFHYFDYDQNYPNLNYMKPTQFLPPMLIRLGIEMNL